MRRLAGSILQRRQQVSERSVSRRGSNLWSLTVKTTKYSSSMRWLSAIGAGLVVLGASSLFLSKTTPTVVAAAVATPAKIRTTPSYIVDVIPIPAGTISAIAPLPIRQVASAGVPAAVEEVAPKEQWRVNTAVNVRGAPSKSGERLGAFEAGELVSIIERRGNWVLVEAPQARRGWVFAKFLTPVSNEAVASID
jgi:hypothetical protein